MRSILIASSLALATITAPPVLARTNPHAGVVVEIPVPSAGNVKIVKREYTRASEGQPYTRAEVAARRETGRDIEMAETEVRFQLAAMALEAGWRYIEVSELSVFDDIAVRRSSDIGGFLGEAIAGALTKNSRKGRDVIGSVYFVDSPNDKTVDALDSFNRLGRQLFGDQFTERTAPASTKRLAPGRDKSGW